MQKNTEKLLAIFIVIITLLSLSTVFVSSESSVTTKANSAALYEPESKKFIYSKNVHQKLAMASTTKIMTALITLDNVKDLDRIITVDNRAVGVDGSSIYLKEGEKISIIDLLYALMLSSANDAASALAYEISGSIERFSGLMNNKAAVLGLSDSNFENPHGLDSNNHYTSAYDLAIITAEAMKNETFLSICSTYKKEIETSLSKRTLINHNKLLNTYDGCIGVKTGYTKKSGRSLVSAAKRDNLTLIGVTIDDPNDWIDHKNLLNYGFSKIHAKVVLQESEFNQQIPLLFGEKGNVSVTNKDSIKVIYTGDFMNTEQEIIINSYLVAPIQKGDTIGKILIKSNGKTIASTDIVSTETVNNIEKSLPKFFKRNALEVTWKKSDFKNLFLMQA